MPRGRSPWRPVTLALGLAKPEKIEESIRMATEIGVSAVRLFASDRSVTRWDEGKRDAKLVRLRRIAQEAAEVCFRTRLPEISFAKDLAQVLQDPTAVLLSETEGLSQLFTPPPGPVTLVIGPEGGWSPREVALIGDRAVTLGPRVFRVDTAGACSGWIRRWPWLAVSRCTGSSPVFCPPVMRPDGRAADELRPTTLERNVIKFAEGSCLIKQGDTHVLVCATVEDRVAPWLKGTGQGWVTAEYSMLPRSGRQRNQRDGTRGPNGRSLEIQRLIGRALRSVVDLDVLGERTITLDCDAILADGGTRCASITAAYVALYDALTWMKDRRMIKKWPLREGLAAISVGILNNEERLDLCYEEDSRAATDMNVVMTSSGRFVEIQGTAEAEPFGADALGRMLKLGQKGVTELLAMQNEALGL